MEGVVIVEFPTLEAAKTWYDSPAYREARDYRFRGAIIGLSSSRASNLNGNRLDV